MTNRRENPPGAAVSAERLLLPVFITSFGAMMSFYLLLSVVPQYANAIGAGGLGAGLATGMLMGATVAVEIVTPRLLARFGYRALYAASLVLLGAPALALPFSHSIGAILAVCVVRGAGFAAVAVIGSALVAALSPEERRGANLGLYGVVTGVPAVVALPLGVWLTARVGFTPVFISGALFALAVVPLARRLPRRAGGSAAVIGLLAALRTPGVVRPAVVFATTAMAASIVMTFVPLVVADDSGDLAALALLVHAAAATLARWWAGNSGDRHSAGSLLTAGVFASAAGLLAMVATTSQAAVLLGVVLLGAAFGVAQQASLTMMFNRVPASGFDSASAIWNLGYDAGLGLGGVGFGALAAGTGYPMAFLVAALLMLIVVVPSRNQNEPRALSCQ